MPEVIEGLSRLDRLHPPEPHCHFAFIGVDPSKHLVEITAFDSAIIRTTGTAHGKASDRKGPIIRGITFTQYAYRAIDIEGKKPATQVFRSTFSFGYSRMAADSLVVTPVGSMTRALAVPTASNTTAPASAPRQIPIFVLITSLLSSPVENTTYPMPLRSSRGW